MTHLLAALLRAFVAAGLVTIAPLAGGADETFEIFGKYERIQPPQPTDSGDKVEVVEMFWYGCPHCFTFLPVISHWEEAKPEYVEFRRMPAVFRDNWVPHARAYYTAELLGVVDKIHTPLFDAIHVKKRKLDTKDALMAFFQEHGIAREDFIKTYDSFAVETLVRRSTIMQERYGIEGTPAVIVNGKYRTSGNIAGSQEQAMRVVQVLAEKEHQGITTKR